jgi:fructosamine-3-kinase
VNATFLEPALRAATGDASLRVNGAAPLGGGLHAAVRLETTAGTFFAKWSDGGPADQFLAEAAGLQAMAAAGTGLTIPRVIAAAEPGAIPGFLVLEFLEPGPADDEALGRGLAALHRSTQAHFGFPRTTYCGGTPQDNRPCDDWPEFYRERRLRPLLDALGVSPGERAPFERLAGRLSELVASDEPPALIHGDLWSGNVLRTRRGPALVDPSCAYAAREMEFGITTLFGGLSPRAWAAYEEAWPLAPGWRERNPLYQLYHLLNHALLFGGGYFAQAAAIARRFA